MGRAQKESREVARRGRDEYVPVRGRCILLTADLPRSFPPRGASSQASTRAALVARLGGVRAVRPRTKGLGMAQDNRFKRHVFHPHLHQHSITFGFLPLRHDSLDSPDDSMLLDHRPRSPRSYGLPLLA